MVVNWETLRPFQESHLLGKYGLAVPERRKSSTLIHFRNLNTGTSLGDSIARCD